MTSPSDVLTALLLRTGAANGIKGADLSRQVGCSERDIRGHISTLRLEGTAVCGTPETGYFIAETDAELEATCNFHATPSSSTSASTTRNLIAHISVRTSRSAVNTSVRERGSHSNSPSIVSLRYGTIICARAFQNNHEHHRHEHTHTPAMESLA